LLERVCVGFMSAAQRTRTKRAAKLMSDHLIVAQELTAPAIFTGAPHFGHAAAVLLTCSPHSWHFTKAMTIPGVTPPSSYGSRAGK